ncbi:MAG TPA: glycosyltransferase family 39 protein [Anaerolineae bacterium]|nr:glycosyltransferase family 39 protein [Anaerolineae bacterium]
MIMHHASRITILTPRRELALVAALLLIAFFFRAHELAGLGLGLEHDEVAEWLIADGIRTGQHALFFEEAYGQEPLFLYLMTGSIALLGDNVIGVRFTSAFVAMLTLAAAYRMLRRMFGPTVALVALAGMSIALWPVFWGRVGLRAMTLPLMLCLGFDFLWRGLTAECGMQNVECRKWFVWAGACVGLSAYTYLSARAVPILLAAFALHLALFARDRMRDRWKHLALFLAIAAVVALPLALAVLANPDLQFRVSEVSAPLDKALQGDWSDVSANIPRALGMFALRGDGTVRDNWPDRPVFPEPIGGLLFGLGFLVALTRVRQPRYALALIWIGAMLIPTIVTTGAPNFTRALGALPMVFALPGIAVDWLAFWTPRWIAMQHFHRVRRILAPILASALLAVFAVNAASTYDDYFNKWPQHPETQFVFQADFAAIAKDIDASGVMDVAVGGLSNDTLDDPSLYLLRRRKGVRVRWFDPGSPLSSGGAVVDWYGSPRTIYVPGIVPVAPLLADNLRPNEHYELVATDRFRRYYIDSSGVPGFGPGDAVFEDTALLRLPRAEALQPVRAGDDLQLETTWMARAPVAYPRRIFVHLVNPTTGQIAAQHDGLDAPSKFWREGDYVTQLHTLEIPASTAAGPYELWIGLYDPASNRRVPVQSDPPNDHVVLGPIEVTR